MVASRTYTEATVLAEPVKVEYAGITSVTQFTYSLHSSLPDGHNCKGSVCIFGWGERGRERGREGGREGERERRVGGDVKYDNYKSINSFRVIIKPPTHAT